MSLQPGRVPVAAQAMEDLPGSVPELKDERPIIHNTQFDQYEDRAGQTGNKYTHAPTHTHIYNLGGGNCSKTFRFMVQVHSLPAFELRQQCFFNPTNLSLNFLTSFLFFC